MNDLSSLPVPSSVLIAAGCCAAAAVIYQTTRKTNKDNIPQVPGLPLIGNALEMDHPDRLLTNLAKHAQKYGPTFRLQIFNQQFLHLSDAGLCREFQAKGPKGGIIRGKTGEYMAYTLGILPYGLFHANDAAIWGKLRKSTAPALSKQNVANMCGDFAIEAMDYVQRLDGLVERGEKIDIVLENTGFTVRVINRVAFGNDQQAYFVSEQFSIDAHLLTDILLDSALFPLPPWVWKLSPKMKKEIIALEANERFSQACLKVISIKRKHLAAMTEEEKKSTHSLLDMMLRQEGASDEEVLANVKTFYVAGSDTTSMTISWAMFMLAQNPAMVDRLRREVADFFTVDPRSRPAAEVSDAITAMTFTHSAMKEAVRLYPAGPVGFFDFMHDEAITLSNGLVITPDTTVIVNMWLPMLNEDNFADARSYKPDRWLTDDKVLLRRMEQAFFGFGGGARSCPGAGLAMAEGTLGLAAVFHYFDVELLCPPEEVIAEFKFTLQPNKLPMKLTRRAGLSVNVFK